MWNPSKIHVLQNNEIIKYGKNKKKQTNKQTNKNVIITNLLLMIQNNVVPTENMYERIRRIVEAYLDKIIQNTMEHTIESTNGMRGYGPA